MPLEGISAGWGRGFLIASGIQAQAPPRNSVSLTVHRAGFNAGSGQTLLSDSRPGPPTRLTHTGHLWTAHTRGRVLPPHASPAAPALTAWKPGSPEARRPSEPLAAGSSARPPLASPAGGGARPGRPDWSDCGRSRTLLRTLLRVQKRQFQHWGGPNSGTQELIGQLPRPRTGRRLQGWGRVPGGRAPIGQDGAAGHAGLGGGSCRVWT